MQRETERRRVAERQRERLSYLPGVSAHAPDHAGNEAIRTANCPVCALGRYCWDAPTLPRAPRSLHVGPSRLCRTLRYPSAECRFLPTNEIAHAHHLSTTRQQRKSSATPEGIGHLQLRGVLPIGTLHQLFQLFAGCFRFSCQRLGLSPRLLLSPLLGVKQFILFSCHFQPRPLESLLRLLDRCFFLCCRLQRMVRPQSDIRTHSRHN